MHSRALNALMLALSLVCVLAGCTPDPDDVSPDPLGDIIGTSTLLRTLVERVVLLLEISGIAVIVVGMAIASAAYGYRMLKHGVEMSRYEQYREHLGQVILLGLEFLVAADIVGTVAVSPTYQNVGSLAIIVIIRTFLSFTLEVETTGSWPWQRHTNQK